MRRTTLLPQSAAHRHRLARRLTLAACVIVSALALPATPAKAGEGIRPLIGPISFGGRPSGEGLIEAQINPEWHETTWEITLNCPGQERCQHTEGQLSADHEEHTVALQLTGLEPGGTYRFWIEAHSTAGGAVWPGEFTVPEVPPGAAPEGVKEKEPYTPPESLWANQSGKEAAERTVAEQHAKEHEEQQAKEAAAQRATEAEALKRHQEEQAEQAFREREEREDKEAEHPACLVPALKGDTLTAARHALAKAHCRLGAVHQPRHHHGTLRVSAQGTPAGTRLAGGARVMLWIGAKGSGAKRASRR